MFAFSGEEALGVLQPNVRLKCEVKATPTFSQLAAVSVYRGDDIGGSTPGSDNNTRSQDTRTNGGPDSHR